MKNERHTTFIPQITYPDGNSHQKDDESVNDIEADDLFRIQQSESDIIIQKWPTEYVETVVQTYISDLHTINNILVGALHGYKKYFDYTGHYIAFLLGQITEKEFEEISKDYSPQRDIPRDELQEKISIILEETNLDFSSLELSAIFSVPREQVDTVLSTLSGKSVPSLPKNE